MKQNVLTYDIIKMEQNVWRVCQSFIVELTVRLVLYRRTRSPSGVAAVRSCIDRVVLSVTKDLEIRPVSPPYGPV